MLTDMPRTLGGYMTLAVCAQTLPAGTVVRDWKVDGVFSVSEEAVLYTARHAESGESVFLQEYFPTSLGLRQEDGMVSARSGAAAAEFSEGRETFLMQGAVLAGLRASKATGHLPRVRTVFAHLGTAYMVMDCYGGVPLQSELASGYRPPEEKLIALFRPMVLALGQLHDAGICHHRIHPGAIFRQQRRLLLTGFAGGFASRDWEDDRNVAYSPIELLVPVATPGPWSDIYSLGAVLYHCVTGAPPPEAVTRLGDVQIPSSCASGYSPAFLKVIVSALSCLPSERPQSIREWCAAWPQVIPDDSPVLEPEQPRHRPLVPLVPETPPPPQSNLILAGMASVQRLGRRWSARAGPMALPCLGGILMASGVMLALSQARTFLPEKAEATSMDMLAGGFLQPESAGGGRGLSAPLLLLEHELTTARDTQKHIDAQVREAAALNWPEEQQETLRRISEKVARAVTEMEALYAAPDVARGKTAAPSFLTVLEQQGKSVRAALREAWELGVAGYAGAGERLRTTADANYHALDKMLAKDDRPEPTLLRGTAATAHGLLGAAYQRLKAAADAEAPANPVAASRQLAEISAAFGEVQSQAATIREALQSGRKLAAQRADELSDLAKERKEFRAALISARRSVAALERAVAGRDSKGSALTGERRAEAMQKIKEANRRLTGLERIVLDTPDIRGPRLQAALLEVRETEKGLRGLLKASGQQEVADVRAAPDPEVFRLLSRADSRLARDYRRYAELQEKLVAHGGLIRVKDGDWVGGANVGRLYSDLKKLAAIRESLSATHSAAEAERIYQQFLRQHKLVDDQLDRLLTAASRAQRRSGQSTLR